MYIIFSPSKTMAVDTDDKIEGIETQCLYEDKAIEIIRKIRSMSLCDIEKKMKIKGEKLIELLSSMGNFELLKGRRALEAYRGISFKQLQLNYYKKDHWDFVKDKVRILSALYGVNRGTDLINIHRLDMTMKIMDDNPYKYWKNTVNNSELFIKDEIILNLASNEFSKIMDKSRFNIINVDFIEKRNGEYKNISTNSKKARGIMLNYIIQNKIQNTNDLINFQEGGYKFSSKKSTKSNMVFTKEGD